VPVVVAPGRSTRPGALGRTTRIAGAATCPFCAGHEAMTPPEVLALGRAGGEPDTPGWTVRVVPNKFPAIPGQEVVVHGPEHVTAFAELPLGVVTTALDAWMQRRAHAERMDAGPAYLLAAINEGPAAGASLDHSHSQLVPFAEIPPAVAAEMPAFAAPCALCAAAVGEDDSPELHLADTLAAVAPERPGVKFLALSVSDAAEDVIALRGRVRLLALPHYYLLVTLATLLGAADARVVQSVEDEVVVLSDGCGLHEGASASTRIYDGERVWHLTFRVRERHEWTQVANSYVNLVERCHAERSAARGVPGRPATRNRNTSGGWRSGGHRPATQGA